MILYHFTADRCLRNILRKGLNEGAVCEYNGKRGFIVHRGWIWLTTDPDRANQSWATRHIVQYSRTAWRLTVEIPEDKLDRLYDRDRLVLEMPRTWELFEGWRGSENWRIYHGSIPREWIMDYVRVEK